MSLLIVFTNACFDETITKMCMPSKFGVNQIDCTLLPFLRYFSIPWENLLILCEDSIQVHMIKSYLISRGGASSVVLTKDDNSSLDSVIISDRLTILSSSVIIGDKAISSHFKSSSISTAFLNESSCVVAYNFSFRLKPTEIKDRVFSLLKPVSSEENDLLIVNLRQDLDYFTCSNARELETIAKTFLPTAPLPISVEERCPARVGFLGNPSDGFRGKTLSFLLDNFAATVSIEEQDYQRGIQIHERSTFSDFSDLFTQSTNIGYSSGMKLIQATCKVFSELCYKAGILAHLSRGFQISFSTTIPRMVGLSGSSAIVVAAFRALQSFYCVSDEDLKIKKSDLPEIILGIERDELGIAAGLQDRVIQVYGGLVYMDFTKRLSDQNIYEELNPHLLPNLYLLYNTSAGGDSGKVHSTVRDRWQRQDPDLIAGMNFIAGLASEAVECLQSRNYSKLADLMDANFETRRRLYSDAVVGFKNIEMVELLRAKGFAAKFSGSGGAIICLRRGFNEWLPEKEEGNLRLLFRSHQFALVRVLIP